MFWHFLKVVYSRACESRKVWVKVRKLKKRNLDSRNKSCIMIVTEPTMPLIFHAQPGGTFSFMGCLCSNIQNKY